MGKDEAAERCPHCGGPGRAESLIPEVERVVRDGPDGLAFELGRLMSWVRKGIASRPCTGRCLAAVLEEMVRARKDRAGQRRELRCLREQTRAFRLYLRTGDPAAFRSLPPGYGPAPTSPTS